MRKPPAEVVASLLAVSTLFVPAHLPPWAIFISWAGTFAAGGPKPENLRKIWVTMPIGAIVACLIVACFNLASQYLSGNAFVLAQCIILFSLNASMMSLGRIPALSFVPGMFFGFASYFATFFGGFGPSPGNLMVALAATILMNAIGPAYAWLTANLGAHHHHADDAAPLGRAQQATS
jgi:hypothetical protein